MVGALTPAHGVVDFDLWRGRLLQTGSGKTHTMLGDIDHLGDRPSDNRGMTPRVFEYLFSRIHLVRVFVSVWDNQSVRNRFQLGRNVGEGWGSSGCGDQCGRLHFRECRDDTVAVGLCRRRNSVRTRT